MTDDQLVSNLVGAIAAIVHRAEDEHGSLASMSPHEASQWIASWPQTATTNAAAAALARARNYLHRPAREGVKERWGRTLSPRSLRTLGIAGLLRQPDIPEAFPAELAAYLAGPAVVSERLVVIDADLNLDRAHDVAGWTMSRPTQSELDDLVALPSTKAFIDEPWDPALRTGGCVVLRRSDPELAPRDASSGLIPRFLWHEMFDDNVTSPAWEPLLLLNLAQPERVLGAAEYGIEPGRRVERVRGTGLGVETHQYADDEEFERPSWGPCQPGAEELAALLKLMDVLSPHLAAWTQVDSSSPRKVREKIAKETARLQRTADRLLALGPRVGWGGDPLHRRDRAEIVFWSIAALENLFVTDSAGGDYTRKLAQRIAVLLAHSDEERLLIHRTIVRAYKVRSEVAHGSDVREADLAELAVRMRTFLRHALACRIVLGPLADFAAVCDEALLSEAVRAEQLHEPVERVRDLLQDR